MKEFQTICEPIGIFGKGKKWEKADKEIRVFVFLKPGGTFLHI